jgi:hypothetical protein
MYQIIGYDGENGGGFCNNSPDNDSTGCNGAFLSQIENVT